MVPSRPSAQGHASVLGSGGSPPLCPTEAELLFLAVLRCHPEQCLPILERPPQSWTPRPGHELRPKVSAVDRDQPQLTVKCSFTRQDTWGAVHLGAILGLRPRLGSGCRHSWASHGALSKISKRVGRELWERSLCGQDGARHRAGGSSWL